MKSILFVNGCIRGEESRTLLLARRFLDCLRGKYEITEVDGICLPFFYVIHDLFQCRFLFLQHGESTDGLANMEV